MLSRQAFRLQPRLLRSSAAAAQARFASTLIVAEHDNMTLNAATLSVVTAASKVGGEIDVVVGGSGCGAVADAAAKVPGIRKVFCADAAVFGKPVAEDMEKLILQIHSANKYSHILAPASAGAKSSLPRVAAKLDVNQLSDVIGVVSEDTFMRPIYAGNAQATVKSTDSVKVMTVRPTSFEKAAETGGSGVVEAVTCEGAGMSKWKSEQLSKSDRPDLAAASTVIAGGRGLKSGDNFKLVYDLADKLGAAVGASRAAVDAGYIGNDLQIGQTGKVVAPELYVAVGISGAIQHLAGMKDSKTIVAINKDPDAPIFQVADMGLVDDLFTAVPAMTAGINK
jgi:electron transfer flavoprotein alpha subunit